MTGVSSFSRQTRGQMAVFGLVLLIGIVAIASVGILLVVGQSTSELQQQAEQERVTQAFVEMSKELETASAAQDVSRSLDFSVDEGVAYVDEDAGWVNVEIPARGGTCTIIDREPMGAVIYESKDTEIALQGGGVWSYDGTHSTMVSPPSLYHNEQTDQHDTTLTLALPRIAGDVPITDQTSIEHTKSDRKYPSLTSCEGFDQDDLLKNGNMNITIHSTYYHSWGQFFESNSIDDVVYDHDSKTVSINLPTEREPIEIDGPIVSDAASLGLSNSGAIDSYDSTEGPYTTPGNHNAPVIVKGDFNPSNSVTIRGSVSAGGNAFVANKIEVTGPTIIEGSSTISNNPVFGGLYSTGGDLTASGGTFENDVIVGGDVIQLQGVTINGDVHVDGNTTINQNTEITGDLLVAGDVSVANGATIHGEIHAGRDVSLTHQAAHHNNVYAGGSVVLESNGATIRGTVEANGQVELESEGEIDGNVIARSDVTGDGNAVLVGHNAEITGDVTAGDEIEVHNQGTIGGSQTENVSLSPQTDYRTPDRALELNVEYPEPVNELISSKETDLSSSNDNDEISAIQDGRLVDCASTCTLDDGSYYLEGVNLDGHDTLRLDTTDGEIELYVDSDISLTQSAKIVLDGNSQTTVYLNGDYQMSGSAQIVEPGHRASTFWVNMKYENSVNLANNAQFIGVIFGPGTETESGVMVGISNQVEIFGAIVGDISQTSNRNEIHFDEALINSETSSTEEARKELSYVDVRINEITFKSA